MRQKKFNIIFMFFTFIMAPLKSVSVNAQEHSIDAHHKKIEITFAPQAGEYIYRDFISFSINNPHLILSPWESDKLAHSLYDATFKNSEWVFNEPVTITLAVTQKEAALHSDATIFAHYLTNTEKTLQEYTLPLSFDQSIDQQPEIEKKNNFTTQECPTHVEQPFSVLLSNALRKFFVSISEKIGNIKKTVSHLVETTQTPLVRFALVFALGILMSLTPCIYPMIPITIGILQTSAGSTLLKNFLLAASYSCGLAITFAFLGFLAAIGSAQFGMLLGNPFFIIVLVAFLAYLAFAMLGFYEMYIPRFMQPKNHQVRQGSYLSAFVFGALSGTVASPCLSPGLVLLLSIVATLGNKLIGFLLLFSFGLGLSVPLLIIGTFSNSLTVLPRAGLWMVEVKKLFGFMLISMCFYYLSTILAWHLILWLIALFLFVTGIFYHYSIKSYDSTAIKRYKQIVGAALTISSMVVAMQAYKATHQNHQAPLITTSYEQAHQEAITDNKLLLLDFGAAWCTSCKALEKMLYNEKTVAALKEHCAMTTIDCTDPYAQPCAMLQKKFDIFGFPTVLLINPKTDMIAKRWGSELLDLSLEELSREIIEVIKNNQMEAV